jgi:hypothetical protein
MARANILKVSGKLLWMGLDSKPAILAQIGEHYGLDSLASIEAQFELFGSSLLNKCRSQIALNCAVF